MSAWSKLRRSTFHLFFIIGNRDSTKVNWASNNNFHPSFIFLHGNRRFPPLLNELVHICYFYVLCLGENRKKTNGNRMFVPLFRWPPLHHGRLIPTDHGHSRMDLPQLTTFTLNTSTSFFGCVKMRKHETLQLQRPCFLQAQHLHWLLFLRPRLHGPRSRPPHVSKLTEIKSRTQWE